MASKWKSRYSPGKKVSTHQYILEIVCGRLASKDGKELPHYFWKLPEWKWQYIKNSSACKNLREKHGEDKVLDFVLKNNVWSLKASWVDKAISDWSFSNEVKKIEKLDTVDKPTTGKAKKSKTNLFKGL